MITKRLIIVILGVILLGIFAYILYSISAPPATLPEISAEKTPVEPVVHPGEEVSEEDQKEFSFSPEVWSTDVWGGTEAQFVHPVYGLETDARKVEVTKAGEGDAKWLMKPLPVTPGETYRYQEAYRATVPTEIDIQFLRDGQKTADSLKTLPEASGFQKVAVAFTVPEGVEAIRVFHIIEQKGTLTIRDVEITKANTEMPAITLNHGETAESETRGYVSLDFDDGWESQYENVLPILQEAGIKSTFYIITRTAKEDWVNYMSATQVKELQKLGHDVEAHTVTHPNLSKMDPKDARFEIVQSKTYLEGLLDKKVTMLAYPYGNFDSSTIDTLKEAGYLGARTVFKGVNTPDTDPYKLHAFSVDESTSFLAVKELIDKAIETNGWVILTFHQVEKDSTGKEVYSVTPEFLGKIVNYIQHSKIEIITDREGLRLLRHS